MVRYMLWLLLWGIIVLVEEEIRDSCFFYEDYVNFYENEDFYKFRVEIYLGVKVVRSLYLDIK